MNKKEFVSLIRSNENLSDETKEKTINAYLPLLDMEAYENLAHDEYASKLIAKITYLNEHKNTKIDIEKVKKAIIFTKECHDGQKRDSGEPYYSHPIFVAEMISEHYPETDIIITAILHDVIEDTEATQQTIEDEFGAEIAQNVELLTRNKPQGKITAEDIILNLQSKGMQKLAILKIMDRMHNLMTISAKSELKRQKTVNETLCIFIAIAIEFDAIRISKALHVLCCAEKDKKYLRRHVKRFHVGLATELDVL
jgi:(p)ppGpp synthase/HD superfamily hydrolase